MSESDVAELCRRIYQKHQRALDLIYDHRPDKKTSIRNILQEIIAKTPGLLFDGFNNIGVYFVPQEWCVPALISEKGERILKFGFYFYHKPDKLKLELVICPGPQEPRERLFQVAVQKEGRPFWLPPRRLNTKYIVIYHKNPFLIGKSYESASVEEITEAIRKHWKPFIEHDLPQIKAAMQDEKWIWEEINWVPHPLFKFFFEGEEDK